VYTDYGYFEEEQLGKTYDMKLLLRLYPFSKPYIHLLALSVFLVVVITIFDLSLPFLTKIAIDRYIVPRPVPARSSRLEAPAADNVDKKQGVKPNDQSDEKIRYVQVDLTVPGVRAIVENHPDRFRIFGDTAHISFDDLKKMNNNDLNVLRAPARKGIGKITALFIAIVLGNYILTFLQMMTMEYAGQKIMHGLRVRLFTHIQTMSIAFFNRNPVGRLVTRVTNDIQNMNELFTSVITFVFKDLFLLVGIAVVLVGINWKLALVSFTVIPFVMVASIVFSVRARDAFRILRIKIAEINSRLSETISGMKVIQLFNRQADNYRRFARLNHENYLANMRQVRVFALFMPVIELLGVVAVAVVIFYGGADVLSGSVSLGALVAFISYMKMFFQPIRDISEKYHIMQNAMASAERIFLIMDTRNRSPIPYAENVPGRPSDRGHPGRIFEIEFQDVRFGYTPGEDVLEDISFGIRSGETVAVVGPTGSGKTTLLNLITRFYDPISGRILINGQDIKTMPVSDLRSKMAMVMQEPFLFSETIRSNIVMGKNDITGDRLSQILDASNCKALVDQMPQGLDTVLSEGAATLSSGERQLISIARALAHDPELIIFDEATSYIDSETEKKIQEALSNLMKRRTSILVAHRLSTARNADKIVVLNRGRIIEAGSHGDLMHRNGFYYRLIQLQNHKSETFD
jgi:ATP-binding cassette subfamily B protein